MIKCFDQEQNENFVQICNHSTSSHIGFQWANAVLYYYWYTSVHVLDHEVPELRINRDFLAFIWGNIRVPYQWKTSKILPKLYISRPMSKFYIFVKISWKSDEMYQCYRCMQICLNVWMKAYFRSRFCAIIHKFLWWAITATCML